MMVLGAERSREEVLGAIYAAMLAHPDDAWRTKNQWVYALLRDLIAEELGGMPELIQASFELVHERRANGH